MAKILIVEDEKILGEMYRDKFQEAGHQTGWVSTSEEAVEYLKKQKPDLILLDILLPKGNGISFLTGLKKNKEFSGIKVLVFSNYDDPKTKKEARDLGAEAYILKTEYTPGELLKKVEVILKEK